MNILLTNPGSSSVFGTFGFIFPPTGLLYIAAAAEKQGYRVQVEDFLVSSTNPSSFNFHDYDVVGITSDTRRFSAALEIAKKAKEQGCTVIMGGAHPAFVDENVLKENYADFVVRGEGEITFPELLDAIKNKGTLSEVKGISYLGRGEVIRTEPRELLEDLDSLPFPARHLIDMNAYKKSGLRYGGKRAVAVISASRGCPNDCNFCVTPRMYGNRWRARSAASIVSEIESLYHEYGYRAFAFCDDNFTVSPRRVKEFCSLIIEKNIDIWWWCLSTAEMLLKNEDMVEMMAKAGARTVFIGVESASPSTLKEFNKKIRVDTPSKTIALLKKNGIETYASYIIGGLNDNTGSILETIRLAKQLDSEVAQFTILTPYPGTRLYDELKNVLRHHKWRFYDSFHLVFRHRNVSYILMQLLLLWAYISYYARGWKSIKGFIKALVKNTSVLRTLYARTD